MNSFKVLAVAPLLLLAGFQSGAEVEITIGNLRNQRGDLLICLTRRPANFPDCGGDRDAVKRTVPASTNRLRLNLSPGTYAMSIIHDENRDRELNTFLGIPREGFGFSRNPRIRFGAPRFEQVRIAIGAGISRLTVNMQYLL